MNNLIVALVMGFSSINTNFAYTSPSHVNENNLKETLGVKTHLDSTTGLVTSVTSSNTSNRVLKSELIQPNAFLDYEIDLNYNPKEMSYSKRAHALGAIQPNAFLDYGIDLNYKGSSLVQGVNVGELSNATIKSESNHIDTQDKNKVLGYGLLNPMMFFSSPGSSLFFHVMNVQFNDIIELKGFTLTKNSVKNTEYDTQDSPNFLIMFFNFI